MSKIGGVVSRCDSIAVLSRGANKAGKPARGGSLFDAEVKKVIERITAFWLDPDANAFLRVVDTAADLLALADAQNTPHDEIDAVAYKGHVYIVCSNMMDGPRLSRPYSMKPAVVLDWQQ